MLHRQGGDRDGQRDQQQEGGENPEEKRAGSGVRGGGDPASAYDARNDEEREVAEPEFLL
jgi:hypothetical protein